MKEFIEKLIGRLELKIIRPYFAYNAEYVMFKDVKRIVNQLAEEYKQDITFQYVLLQADIMKRMGIDVGCKWETATQQASALNEAYMRGRQDERDRFAEWQDEHNNDFCEWKQDEKFNWFFKSPHEGVGIIKEESGLFNFCPYCGKKIKIAPYQPKGE